MNIKKYICLLLVIFSAFFSCGFSNYVIPGGENLGIEISTDGIMIIGFYKVNGKLNKGTPALKVGDVITKVEDTNVDNIDNLIKLMEEKKQNDTVNLTIKRNNKYKKINLELKKEDNIYKTGLFVKDSITGIGTLTYIDPKTHKFGALGHEIIESNSNKKIEVKTGFIFKSSITSIDRSSTGVAGGKKAKFYYDFEYGTINKNTKYGIYGTYEKNLPEKQEMQVAKNDEVKLGNAKIYTVLNDEKVEAFDININKIDKNHDIKNIYFNITSKELLVKTGGVVQGMSGSPIIQDDKIVGAVTHVIVDDPKTGYGIFITSMLKEGEKN